MYKIYDNIRYCCICIHLKSSLSPQDVRVKPYNYYIEVFSSSTSQTL